jgi:peptide/nickel transport system substrate-binding protein
MEFRVLGPLEAWQGGRRLAVGGPKQQVLLAILLLRANEVVPRPTLVEELWGERAPPSAVHSLDTYVHRLRRAFAAGSAEPRLETREGGYRLRVETGELDLDGFLAGLADGRRLLRAGEPGEALARLEAALAHWRGPPLAGLEDEPFAAAEIRRLEELRAEAVEERIDAELALGRHRELVGELQALVVRHPLRERLTAQLMLALYRAGRHVEALDAFREMRGRLASELGLEPGPELRALERDVLRHAPMLAAPSAPPAEDSDRRRRGRALAVTVGAGVVAVAAAAAVLAFTRGGSSAHVAGDAVVSVDGSRVVALDGPPTAIASGGGALWVARADAGTVDRVDPRTLAVRQTIQVGAGPTALAAGAGSVWVANSLDDTVSRIDTGTNTAVDTIRVGRRPDAVLVTGGDVWVANAAGPSISRLDARSGRVVATIPLRSPPTALASAFGDVWATSDGARTISRIDARTDSVVATFPVGGGPDAVAFAAGTLWIANALDGTVSRLDPARGVVATIPVGGSPSAIAPAGGGVWVGDDYGGGGVAYVDGASDSVTRRDSVTGAAALATAAGRVWAAVRGVGAGHRGGRLTLVDPAPQVDSLDPALLVSLLPPELLGMTHDGLVTFEHAGGAAGLRLVPDLAVALPEPSDDGLTYRFRLRAGIRYSDGEPLRASDVRHTFERLFRVGSPGVDFYSAILGASACRLDAPRCDLARGIATDDASRTVTFRLARPDPEFLYELALSYAFVVPSRTPFRRLDTRPTPGTGPYAVASYRPRRDLRLVRNPWFHQWSRAAQPDGYPDEIVWRLGIPPGAAVTAIERGNADWMLATGPPPAARRRELETRFARQLHVHPLLASDFFVFNVRTPPFDDVRVRQAVNLALDRRRIVALYGGPLAAQPTCQILPPGMPGYVPYCPYTAGGTASWSRPDLTSARRLVAASGTRGMHITVWNTPDPGVWLDEGTEVVRTLRRLGYRVRYRFLPDDVYEREIGDTRRRFQISSGGWAADYPAASDFIELKLSCRALRPAAEHNPNAGAFCDRRIDAQIDRARSLQVEQPSAANALWSRIDHELTDLAVWLPLVNPKTTDFVSRRVGNYQYHPLWGLLVDQLWVH